MIEDTAVSEAAPDDNPMLAFSAPEPDEQDRMVEAILFASSEPLSTDEIEQRMPKGSDAAEALRRVETAFEGRGVNVLRVAGKWSLRTASDLSFLLREEAQETRKLSRAAYFFNLSPCNRLMISDDRQRFRRGEQRHAGPAFGSRMDQARSPPR